jgi:hypothetical protein
MKYASDMFFLGIAIILFIISAITDNLFPIMFNTSILLILFWIGLLCFILYHYVNHKNLMAILSVIAVVGIVVLIGITSLAHRNIFNFLGWIAIILEIGNVLIKTW